MDEPGVPVLHAVTITMDERGQVSVSAKGADAAAVLVLLEVARKLVHDKQLASMVPARPSIARATHLPAAVPNGRR